MGRGAWAIGDPSPNVKNFTNRSTAQAREESGKHRPGKAEAPRQRTEKFGGFGWFSKRVLEYQKEQIYII